MEGRTGSVPTQDGRDHRTALSRTVVVQHDPDGLDPFTQADTVLRALEVAEETLRTGPTAGQLALAYPLVNIPLLFPGVEDPALTQSSYRDSVCYPAP